MECNQEVCSSWLQRRPDTFICQGRSHKWCRASLTDESIWSKAQPRGISRSLPRRKTGLASNTKKSYIKSKSHCLIFYQSIVGGLYTIISEGKFTQSSRILCFHLWIILCYNVLSDFGDRRCRCGRCKADIHRMSCTFVFPISEFVRATGRRRKVWKSGHHSF